MCRTNSADCYGCAYRRDVPGSAHSKCAFDWLNSEHDLPKGDKHGIENGWWAFPIDFDPVWMLDRCPERSEELDEDMVRNTGKGMEPHFGMLIKHVYKGENDGTD